MKKRFLFRTIVISLAAMLIFGFFSALLIYINTEKLIKNDLIRLSDVIVDEAKRENANLKNLATYTNTGDEPFRVTFIDSKGEVVNDSLIEAGIKVVNENHLSRPEVKAALNGKPEFSKRYSETMNSKMMYYAVSFTYAQSGETYVLRVALGCNPVNKLVWGSIPILAITIVLLAIALVAVNQRYNYSLLVPINEIKRELHTINSGNFKKISINKSNDELLPIINELNEIIENMSSLNRVRSEFFANASHELNTPLTYISGYAELMQSGMLTDPQKIIECGGKIFKSAEDMSKLVDEMLKLSALETPDQELTISEINLKSMIESIVSTFSIAASKKNITINTYIFVNTVVSSEKLLGEVLYNLVQNSIRYNKVGGSVDITVMKNKKRTEITIADTGIGIAQKDQERVFERFYRVDKARSKESGGTGLGLAIAKHSLARLGGSIRLESEPGKGTTFFITL